jgi:cell division septation protein DedD
MDSQGSVRAASIALIAGGAVASLAIAVTLTLASPEGSSCAASSSSVALIAVDTDPSGNGPRTVGAVDECISASAGQPLDIDIVVTSPGIPADRGIAAYQFTILYDPAVVWIGADDSDMLLAQADGSNVIPITDPKPDSNGVYQSWGVDFGTPGIEPSGASETGPGVIARITLIPQGNGVSPLTLSNVLLIDDSSERLSLESLRSASVYVGQPCPGQSESGTPTPTPAPTPALASTPTPAHTLASTPTPAHTVASTPTPAPTPTPTPEPQAPAPAGGAATGIGSLAPAASGVPIWASLMSGLGGTGLLIATVRLCRIRCRFLATANQENPEHDANTLGDRRQ